MKLRLLIFGLAMAAMTVGCFRQDIRTIVVNVPQMKTAECSKLIQDALAKIEGIVTAEPDLVQHTIAVTYDSKRLAIKNIEFTIAGVGFDANDTPGKAEAKGKLPAACR